MITTPLGAQGLARAPAPAQPRVGRYRGLREGGVMAFKGIRYGRAARFARAVPEPFSGPEQDATQFGPLCPQRGMAEAPQSEDCLFLNVWT
ncbi:carboxylesterase family protein, partial [Novosphingobium sp. B-7]